MTYQFDPVPYQSHDPHYTNLRPTFRARMCRITLLAVIATDLLLIPMQFLALWVTNTVKGGARPGPEMLAAAFALCGIGLLSMAAGITCIVFICMWVHRANVAARGTGGEGMEFTPGWAVGWFFIPFANLVMPHRVMQEIWRASNPQRPAGMEWRNDANSGLVSSWWFTWIGSGFMSVTGSVMSKLAEDSPALAQAGTVLQAAALVVACVASVLLIKVIGTITNNLEIRIQSLTLRAE